MDRKNYKFALYTLICFCICVPHIAQAQSGISKVWNGVDLALRNNAPDAAIREALVGAKLKNALPTSGGIVLTYTLADGTEAQCTTKLNTKGEILSAQMDRKKSTAIQKVSDTQILKFVNQKFKNKLLDKSAKVETKEGRQKYQYHIRLNPIEESSVIYEIICESNQKGQISLISSGFVSLPAFEATNLREITDKQMSQTYYKQFVETFLGYYSEHENKESELASILWSVPYIEVTLQTQSQRILLHLIYDNVKNQVQIIKRDVTQIKNPIKIQPQKQKKGKVLGDQVVLSDEMPTVQIGVQVDIGSIDQSQNIINKPDQGKEITVNDKSNEIDLGQIKLQNKEKEKNDGDKLIPEIKPEITGIVDVTKENRVTKHVVELPEANIPEVKPEVRQEVKLPEVKPEVRQEVKLPEVKPEVRQEVKLPEVKLPEVKLSKVKPEVRQEVKLPEVKLPEVRQEVKLPEVKPEVRQEVKLPEVKPEVRQEVKLPEVKPEVRQEVKLPEVKLPEVRQEVKLPEVKPEVRQEVKLPEVKLPEVRQEVKLPEVKPEVRQEVKLPEVKPEVRQEVKLPEVKPEVRQEVKLPEVKPEVRQEVKLPEVKPEVKPQVKPEVQSAVYSNLSIKLSGVIETIKPSDSKFQVNKIQQIKGITPQNLQEKTSSHPQSILTSFKSTGSFSILSFLNQCLPSKNQLIQVANNQEKDLSKSNALLPNSQKILPDRLTDIKSDGYQSKINDKIYSDVVQPLISYLDKSKTNLRVYDQNCLRYTGSKCSTCYNRFFLGQSGQCEAVDAQCENYNSSNGYCLKCYTGNVLKDGVCSPNDPFCILTDNVTKKCTRCLKGFLLVDGKCKKNSFWPAYDYFI